MNKLQNFVVWLDGYLEATGDEKEKTKIKNVTKDDIQNLIEIDSENEKMYLNEHLYYYELNIRKIKNELEVR
jgi:hypothetical protein